ncbi:UDP-2,3-diacylglucosamine diphosphatase [Thauera butanivorans]|uniref:UDP-2,3-diacylglucosamine diphosphatase n=1 Tax=Thauera butanivorans TaxID=86174 RepID=UPI003AB428C6
MRLLFISDLHLSEDHPETVAAFLAFLAGPAREARALYILGDLFEYWAGDDDGDAPLNRDIASALAATARAGTAIHFMPGNRDFLLGADYAARAGMDILPDPWLLQTGDSRLLLSHGDILCTDDAAYQAYRAQVRDPAWQAAFLARPLSERKALIDNLRRLSTAENARKSMEIMDVNADAVAALLRAHHYPTLIHGHTHRPAHHRIQIDGHACSRHVLADWHGSAPHLAFDGQQLSTSEYRPS